MKRYPDGIKGEFFFEKRCPVYRPSWMATRDVSMEEETVPSACLINNIASLIWVANLGSIELHTQLFRVNNTERQTAVVFDFDPGPGADIFDCITVALELRAMLLEWDLESYPKVSGGKGLHFYVPLNTSTTFEQTRLFAHSTALIMEERMPQKVVTKMSKSLRKNKVLIDWSQNVQHKTTVSVYSLRALETPTVSAPVTWQELRRALKRKNKEKLIFSPMDVIKRINKFGDLFEDVLKVKQKLPLPAKV